MGLISLSSCSDLPLAPYLIDLKHQSCGEYKVTKENPITFGFVKWHPISDCDGFFAISPEQTTDILRQYRECQSDKTCD